MTNLTYMSTVSALLISSIAGAAQAQAPSTPWPEAIQKSLIRAGANQTQIEEAIRKTPSGQRAAMEFLVRYMPSKDLQTLSAEFLRSEVDLAMKVRSQTPYGKQIPTKIYLNNVLPYVNVSETRESWRLKFQQQFLPLVKKAKTPGDAALILNKTIFGMVKVRYSTQRKRADQSPSESMKIGMASCTGLSILLTNACRAVGVPARLAGIPNWANKNGNHTWVEIWDKGWHFVGAAEPSGQGLNHAWFQGDAALAKADNPKHSIYAVSYRHTGTRFPMVWAPQDKSIHAVNVTHRYTKTSPPDNKSAASRLMICVRSKKNGQRVKVPVRIINPGTQTTLGSGTSKGESADTNDYLTFELEHKTLLELHWGHGDTQNHQLIPPFDADQKIITVYLKN